MSAPTTDDATNRRPADGSSDPEEAVVVVDNDMYSLKQDISNGNTTTTTTTRNNNNSNSNYYNYNYTKDACYHELEQLEANEELQRSKSPAMEDKDNSLKSSQGSRRSEGRGRDTQIIPTRCVRSSRRLLEVLKRKYGENGYSVEMRHNVYTIVTWDVSKGKLSQDEIQNC